MAKCNSYRRDGGVFSLVGKIQINPSTGKVLVIRDSSGISKLCSNCCVAPETEEGFCCMGFGSDETPIFYTATISGIQACSGKGDATILNGEWELELTEHHGGTKCEPHPWGNNDECLWQYIDANVRIRFFRFRVISPLCDGITFDAYFWHDGAWRAAFIGVAQLYSITTGWCTTFPNAIVSCVGSFYGRFGSASVEPNIVGDSSGPCGNENVDCP